MPDRGLHNSSTKSALEQGGASSMKQSTDGKDTLLYPKPDGAKPKADGFTMENSPAGT